jgi:mono/diheme cytochrome c family protein
MLRSFILAAAALVLVANVASAQDKVARGAAVYAEQKCQLCHSVAGKGNAKGPLDAVGTKLSAADLKAWLVDAKGMTAKTKATRKPDMKNYALPDADVDALVAYMQTLKK